MGVVRINELPAASGVTSDDLLIIMDDPSGSGITKKIPASLIGAIAHNVVQLGNVSGPISTDATAGGIFDLTLTASGTLSNPTNPTDGQTLRWRISHGANSLTINLDNKFVIPTSASSPLPFSSTSGVMDLLGATYDSNRDKWDIIAFVPGY